MKSEYKVLENTGKISDRELTFSTFCGPNNKQMLQLTQGFGDQVGPDEPGYIQLSMLDAAKTAVILVEWVKSQSQLRAEELAEQIKKDSNLRKTILQDAVECQKFIEEFKMLELPIRLLS